MKVVILAGGLPSNISDDNDKIPKPMVRIGERPILWHIMKLYSYYGFNDFIICTGYHGELIKRYFKDYYIYRSDITIDLKENDITIHNKVTEPWNVSIIHTGMETTTAERIKLVLPYIEEEDFIVTYGDCISNINIPELLQTHIKGNKSLTVALAKPTGRNAVFPINAFGEKNSLEKHMENDRAWTNSCYMVVKKEMLESLQVECYERFEIEIMNRLIQQGEVQLYKHTGFWIPVETMRDKLLLQNMWERKEVPWKIWED